MSVKFSQIWDNGFLKERPSIGLCFFRLAVAFTVGAHLIPTLLHLDDNYFSTAFKEKNLSFFTPLVLGIVEVSPDWFVIFMTVFFLAGLFCFAVGFFSQVSCVLMTLGCYYFYALNSLHIGTLSFDILLVTLFLMCVTGYHGDFLSVDSLRRGNPLAYQAKRPFFIQRLLQIQIASTFFYTGLSKFTAQGNWLTGNPIYYLLNSHSESVVKHFPLRHFFAQQEHLCYFIGLSILIVELSLPFLLFIRRTRPYAIAYGFLFHLMLLVTLHVPTIFFFLFPPQLLLFIDPEKITEWIDGQRQKNQTAGQDQIIYDGNCGFCVENIRQLKILDCTDKLKTLDYQTSDVTQLDGRLTHEICHSQIHLLTKEGTLYGGFEAFRQLSKKIPLLLGLAPILYFPGMSWLGNKTYRWIAQHRALFHRRSLCKNNRCYLGS
jgi:predicted DCC family thiol-disulfide oxidoreductase YuxK